MRKVLKKSIFTASIAIILAFTLMFSVLGANFEHVAENLRDLGLFRGTETGFELDREPTRAEAVVMMIRFLGLEEAAQAGDADHPFTDVPAWASSYVAYAYELGLTTGATETEFRPNEVCTAQMFVTFMLRALGYDDAAGDFTFANAIPFGTQVGVIDSLLAEGTFLRDDMVAVAFLALNADPKDAEYDSLLEKLVSEGAVTLAAAAPILEFFATYAQLELIDDPFADETNIEMAVNMDIDMGILGSVSLTMNMAMIMEDADIVMKIDIVMKMGEDEIAMNIFVADGFVYTEIDGEKIKVDAGLADLDLESMLELTEMSDFTLNPIYFLTSLTKTTQDELTVFTMTFADSFVEAAMEAAVAMMGTAGVDADELAAMGNMEITVPSMRYYVDADGNLAKMGMVMRMVISEEGLTIPINMDFDIEIIAVGDDVVITPPDNLDEFELVEAED